MQEVVLQPNEAYWFYIRSLRLRQSLGLMYIHLPHMEGLNIMYRAYCIEYVNKPTTVTGNNNTVSII